MCMQHQAIEDHTRRILRAEPSVPYRESCRSCNSERFVRHDVRRREFYWLDELGCSRSCSSWIARWKCLECKTIFTDYPPFALPEKRYTKDTVFDAVQSFCEGHKTTYRSPIPVAPSLEKRAGVAGSTLWRWISWMRSRQWVPMQIVEFISGKYPDSMLHRFLGLVAPWKARSDDRLKDVCNARRFVLFVRIFERENNGRVSPTLQQAAML